MSKTLEIFVDGASKGNPGHAGVGAVICQDGKQVSSLSSYIGTATNNVAEYTALLYALQEAMALKARCLVINTDSELMYRQLTHQYKVKHPVIAGLYQQVMRLRHAFEEVDIRHIPRTQNQGADRLATRAVREALKRTAPGKGPVARPKACLTHDHEKAQASFDF